MVGTIAAVNSSILIGVAAALGAVALALAAALVFVLRRSSRQGAERVSTVVRTLEQRMDELARELAGAVDRAEEEGRRSRVLGEIQGSINLDDVLSRTLEGACAVTASDAALVRLTPRGPDDAPIVASIGVPAEGADAVTGPPDGTRPTIVQVSYSYAEPGEGLIHRGLAVPLVSAAGAVGTLCVYTRDPNRRFDADEGRRLAELAGGASTAIENARQFREARQLADLDALTGLHNRRYFHETLSRECARAHRYNRRLGLIVFDLDDFKDVNDRIGHLSGDAALAEAAERMRSVVRSADIPCRVGGDEFAVVMPESGLEQAEQLFHRLQDVISGRPIGQAGRLRISAGVTELKPDDDSVSFFERADQALYRAKDAGKGRAFTADGHAA
jgi:diguanylate cyclase (GGDEF)-like protein